MKAFQSAAQWDGSAEAGPWLARITVNLSIDRWRRNRRRAQTFTPLAESDHAASLADGAPSPDRRVQGRETGERAGRGPAGPARAPARGRRPAPLPGHEPRGDRAGARDEPRHRQEQPAPRARPDAHGARGSAAVSLPASAVTLQRTFACAAAWACSPPPSSRGASGKRPSRTSQTCARCRAEHDALRAVVLAMEADPLREAEPGVPLAFLVGARRARGRASARSRRGGRGGGSWPCPRRPRSWPPSALVPRFVAPLATGARRRRAAAIPPAEASPLVTEDALARIERNLAREHAVRYLNEAGEVLVTVAATGADCDRARRAPRRRPRPRAQPRAPRAPRPRGRRGRGRRGGGERAGRPRRRGAGAAGGGGSCPPA